jgi:tRNA(fMet)-specific endonuclease VapC
MSLVVDSDVVSLIFKGDSRGEKYLPYLESSELLMSFMSEAELERWFLQARWGSDRVTRFRVFRGGLYQWVPREI